MLGKCPGLVFEWSKAFYIWGESMNKNHEGYRDPTACEAIRRVSRYKRKRRGSPRNGGNLTYKLKEVSGLKQFME